MLSPGSEHKIYLAKGITDLRKSFNGLSILVKQEFARDPYDKNLYVFCNRRRNRLKILQYDHNGFVLFSKALDKGSSSGRVQTIAVYLRLQSKNYAGFYMV